MLEGRWTRIDAVSDVDLPSIYELFTDPATAAVLGFGGAVPSYQQFAGIAYDNIYAQWVVRSRRTNERLGMVQLTRMDLQNGHAHLNVCAWPRSRGSGVVLEGVGLCIDYTFTCWPLRKLYAEVTESAFSQFKSITRRYMRIEGLKVKHVYQMGDYQDVYTLTMDRDTWVTQRE